MTTAQPILDAESLIRFVPAHSMSRNGTIGSGVFTLRRLPSGEDEDYVSLMRSGYQGYQPSPDSAPLKLALGYLEMKAGECRGLQCPVDYALALEPKPTKKFPAHAGLKVFHQGELVRGSYTDEGYRDLLISIRKISSYHPF